jgi:hypothetical protein
MGDSLHLNDALDSGNLNLIKLGSKLKNYNLVFHKISLDNGRDGGGYVAISHPAYGEMLVSSGYL